MKSPKVLFVSAYNTTFVNRDFDSLKRSFDINRPDLGCNAKGFGILKIFCRILSGLIKSDVTLCWFADIRAFIAVWLGKLFKRKVIVIVGGYETTWIPDLNYGALHSKSAIARVKYILSNASKVLFVDESLLHEATRKLSLKDDNFEVLPTNFDPDKFPLSKTKNNTVLTVAVTDSKRTAFIKNLPLFAKLSKQFPAWNFKIIGVTKELHLWLKEFGGDNLIIEEKMIYKNLVEEYGSAQVYCQLSIREGLPNALCEAMLCGCIPVGTKVNGIPYAIGDTGFLCASDDLVSTEKAIEQAMKSKDYATPRERIKALFSIPKRENRLKELLEF